MNGTKVLDGRGNGLVVLYDTTWQPLCKGFELRDRAMNVIGKQAPACRQVGADVKTSSLFRKDVNWWLAK